LRVCAAQTSWSSDELFGHAGSFPLGRCRLMAFASSAGGGAEIAKHDIARLDNAAPDKTDRNCLNIRRPKKKSNALNDKRIKSCLSRFNSGAYSRLQFLRAVSHSVGAHTVSLQPRVDNSSNSNSSEDEVENRQAPVPAMPTSRASESATAPAATTSDDCCEVCIMAPRAGFALVPCGHRTHRQ